MKKFISLLLCGLFVGSAPVSAQKNIDVLLNGNTLTFDQQPVIKNDRTFVPVRKIFESFGMEVEWDAEAQTVYAHNDDKEIVLSIGGNEMWVNGESVQLDAVPFLNGDRAFVPLRAISEALSCVVDWDGIKGTVIIIGIGNGGIIKPTIAPTQKPTSEPTIKPTTAPTGTPSAQPTAAPSDQPTTAPTTQPTVAPTATPTTQPTAAPTMRPTTAPTVKPTAMPTVKPTTAPTQAPSTEAGMEKEVFTLVNKVRAENGLSALTWADDLANVARAHSRDMINRGFFSHTNPDGQSPFDRLKNNGIKYRTAAENIAYGQRTAEAVMNGWMNSSGHRANILNANVKEIGVGAVKAQNGTVYWTQMFIAR